MNIENISNSSIKDLKKIAANPLTPPHLLMELSKHDDSAICCLVASNPNTPEDTLICLVKEFPDAVLENPIVELLDLENSNSYFRRLSLARDLTTPPETLEKLISNPISIKAEDAEICRAVVRNPNTPAKALVNFIDWMSYADSMVSYCQHDICMEIINNPLLTEACVKRVFDSSNDQNWTVFIYDCTQISNLSFDTVEKLSRQREYYNHLLIDLPIVKKSPLILDNIASHWLCQDDTLIEILKNPITSASTLEYIAAHDSPDISRLVTNHPNVSPKALDIISFIREESEISIEVLKELVEKPRFDILKTICVYPYTPSETLEKAVDKLSNSRRGKDNLTVLENLITHPNISSKILHKLLEKLNKTFMVKDGKVVGKPNHIILKVKEKLNEV